VDAVATEDLDCLAFGAPLLLRKFNMKKDLTVEELNLKVILKDLLLNKKQLVDLCILMGCDYTDNIKGILIIT